MQEYIKYFTGLKRNYGVCKTTEGFVDAETGKKRYPHEWSSIPLVEQDYLDHLSFHLMVFCLKVHPTSYLESLALSH